MKQQISSTFAMQRPNRIAAKLNSGGNVQEIYSDGKTAYLYNPNAKEYLKMPVPADVGSSTSQLLGVVGLLLNFLDQDLDKVGQDAQFQMRGTQNVSGRQVQVVEIRQKRNNGSTVTRLFVGVQDRLVYRVEYTETQRMQGGQGANQQPVERTTSASATLQYLSFDRPIPASRFRFTPPKGAREVQPPQMGQSAPSPQSPGRGR